MENVCKWVVVSYDGKVVCEERALPELKDNEVLVKVHASLISPGTEMNLPKAFREKNKEDKTSTPFGYSSAGEIIAVKGDVKDLKVGMRVACMGGGAKHAAYNCVPVNLVVPIPNSAINSNWSLHQSPPLWGGCQPIRLTGEVKTSSDLAVARPPSPKGKAGCSALTVR